MSSYIMAALVGVVLGIGSTILITNFYIGSKEYFEGMRKYRLNKLTKKIEKVKKEIENM